MPSGSRERVPTVPDWPRFLTGRGFSVVEVNRPDRSVRYRKGKSDPTDAEMAARAVLAGVATATPKSGEGEVEMLRMLKIAKDSAIKASHPGRQSDEGFGGHSSRRTAGNAGRPVRHRPRCPVQGLPSGSPRESHGGGQVRSSIPGLPLPSTRQGGPPNCRPS